MSLISNYPGGFANGVSIRNLPVLNSHSGNVFWLDSGGGSDGNKGTFDRPFATLNYSSTKCTANNGDIIMVKAGHAETVATAAAINMAVAGVTVVCLGDGADRATFTFSATASTITVTAASVSFLGFPILVPSIDSVVSPIVVSAADCTLDVEVRDASDAIEFVNGILTTAAADKIDIDIKYYGRTGGNACVNAVLLVGGDGARVNVDFYGKASTAVVEFLTTACTDVNVTGYAYVSGTTDGSKLVVDTVTGSTWYMAMTDGAAGATFNGGSGGAVASGDLSSIEAKIDVIDAFHDVGSADATTNTVMSDVLGNKTDASQVVVGTTRSLVGYQKGLMDSTVRTLVKTDGAVLTGDDPLFTITGGSIHVISIVATVTTVIGGASTAHLNCAVTTPAADVSMSTAVAIGSDGEGAVYTFVGPTGVLTPTDAGLVFMDYGSTTVTPTQWIVPIGTIEFSNSAAQSGVVSFVMTYYANSSATVVVAA